MNEHLITIVLMCFAYTISLYLVYRRHNVKRLEYIVQSRQILSDELNSIDGVALSFDGQNIQNATISIVEIANASLRKINEKDLIKGIILHTDNTGSFLIYENANEFIVSNQRNSSIKLKALDEYTIKIYFESLMALERIRLAILHRGDLFIEGEIKDGIINKVEGDNQGSFEYAYFISYMIFGFTTLIVTGVVALNLNAMGINIGLYALNIIFIVFFAGVIYMIYKHWKYLQLIDL